MRLGIIGLPQSGKTTVFNALTRGYQPLTTSGGRFDVHTGVVDVPDGRIDRLSAMFKPKKTIYAKVTYADIAGLEGSQSAVSGQLLNLLTQMDGLLHVVRCFDNANVSHPAGSVNPLREVELTAEDEKALAGFGFLTRKPLLVLLNLHEGQEMPPVEYPHMHSNLVALQGKLEMEIAQLPPEDVDMFMAGFGIAELGLARGIRLSYEDR